jgi:hypothetical protein
MAPTGIAIDLDLEARCATCGAEREIEGVLVAQGERTTVVDAPTACELCGGTRVKVTVDVGQARGTKAEDEA